MPDEEKNEPCCGNCKWHKLENITDGYVCCNGESEYVADWTEKNFCCIDHDTRI